MPEYRLPLKPHPTVSRAGRPILAALTLLLGLIAASVASAAPLAPRASSSLVINEIDYLQPGQSDPAEFVEILNIGKGPVPLGEHVLVGLNQRGGNYRRIQLPAVPLASGEYFVVCGSSGLVPNCDMAVNFAQNIWDDSKSGIPPNAVAIMRSPTGIPAEDILVDSISYEGDVPGGPPTGGSWTEGAGVDPGDDTRLDFLGLSRSPNGQDKDNNADDFSRRCITPGAANASQATGCAAPARLPGLVVNELDYIQKGAVDEAEFVEIKNTADHDLDLGRYALLGIDEGSKEYRRVNLPSLRLAPGDYYLVCGRGGLVPNCDLAVDAPLADIWNDMKAGVPAAVALVKRDLGTAGLDLLVDSVSYEGNVARGPSTGGSWTETAGVTQTDSNNLDNFGISRSPDGQDSDHNAADFKPRCITPGLPNGEQDEGCPAAERRPDLVINEIDYSQPGATDAAEYVEILNTSKLPIDLGRYDLIGVDQNLRIYRTINLPQRLLAPGAFFVVCNPGGMVPNCDLPAGPSDNAWQDRFTGQSATNAVALLRNPTADPRDDILIDSLSYDGSVDGGPPNGGRWTEEDGVEPGDLDDVAFIGIGRLPDGVDSDINLDDFKQGCSTPGYGNVPRPGAAACPPPGALTPTPGRETPTPTPTDPLPQTPTATATATAVGGGLPAVIRVDDPGDESDGRLGDGRCEKSGGGCTLRAAIEEINADSGNSPVMVVFDTGKEIQVPLIRTLPSLKRAGVTIDGSLGAGPFASLGSSSTPSRLDQSTLSSCSPGQMLMGSGRGSGLALAGSDQVVVGMRISGFDFGIEVEDGATALRIGSDGDGQRDEFECNAIWDNIEAQIRIAGATTRRVWVSGNTLGVDAEGNPGGLERRAVGVDIAEGASQNLIGLARSRSGDLVGAGNVIQRNIVGIRIGGVGSQGNLVLGNQIGLFDSTDWEDRANVLGILLAQGATQSQIGGPRDGAEIEPDAANLISFSLGAGIGIQRGATDNSIRANYIVHNRKDGIRLAQTLSGNNTLRGNSITSNGGAAIAVDPLAPQLQPPVIDDLTTVDRALGAVRGQACAGCMVELFADNADEAARPLGTVAAAANGKWELQIRDLLTLAEVHLRATATDAAFNTSRLGPAVALGPRWRLVEISPKLPRAMQHRSPVFERNYRLLDDRNRVVTGATVVFSPIELSYVSDGEGIVRVQIQLEDALRFGQRNMSLSVEAVDSAGTIHPIEWLPEMVLAREQRALVTGEILLDLAGLGQHGIGALLRRSSGRDIETAFERPFASALFERPFAPSRFERPLAPAQEEGTGLGAAYSASPDPRLREGQYAWQENLARGGGIYELQAGDVPLSGDLEIIAPVEAYNASGPASACPASGVGAVIAGWRQDEGCWVPVVGTSAQPPPAGSSTFRASAPVSISAATFQIQSLAQAGTVITLYTVGFDIDPPVITPQIASGARLSSLPAVLAHAEDLLSGIQQSSGITVTLAGRPIPIDFDAASGELRVDAPDRVLPPGSIGPATLEIRVRDGFCNEALASIAVQLDPSAPPPTVAKPLYIPFLQQRR
jgi:hypothetical protein